MPSPSCPPAPLDFAKQTGTYVRAKALPAMARKPALEACPLKAERLRRDRMLAIAFATALDEAGISNVEAARILSLASEAVVRDLKSRKARMLGVHIMELPEDVLARVRALYRQLLAPLPDALRTPAANDVDAL